MAKNKQKQKGLLESVHDGYIRGGEGRKILLRHESLLRQNHYQMK